MMSRQEMIDFIINQEIKVNSGENDWYLREILENGFKGYDNYSDDEIKKVYEQIKG